MLRPALVVQAAQVGADQQKPRERKATQENPPAHKVLDGNDNADIWSQSTSLAYEAPDTKRNERQSYRPFD